MQTRYSRFIKRLHSLGDTLLLNLAFLLSDFIQNGRIDTFDNVELLSMLMVFNLTWFVTVITFRLYEIYRVTQIDQVIRNLVIAFLLHVLLIFSFIVILKYYDISRKQILQAYLIFIAFILLYRIVFLKSLKMY